MEASFDLLIFIMFHASAQWPYMYILSIADRFCSIIIFNNQ